MTVVFFCKVVFEKNVTLRTKSKRVLSRASGHHFVTFLRIMCYFILLFVILEAIAKKFTKRAFENILFSF
jgi:hypothetical protein